MLSLNGSTEPSNMTLQKSVGFMVALCILLVAPLTIGAAQRALTVDSLEKAYKTRLSALDTDLASTTKALSSTQFKYYPSMKDPAAIQQTALRAEVIRLNEEKRSTEAAYKLLQEALK